MATAKLPFERLMEMCVEVIARATAAGSKGPTLGDLSEKWDQPIERIMDAIDAVRVLGGETTYTAIPPGSES